MKKGFLLIVFFTLVIQAQQSPVDRLFNQANEQYRKENYQDAVTKYEYITAHFKLHSADLYFNLGNAYYKLNQIAPAIYNYERALLLDPDNHDVLVNLGYAQKMMIDESTTVPAAGFTAMLKNFTHITSPDGWAIVAVVFAFLCLVFFCGYYFTSQTNRKRPLFFAMLSAITIVLIAFFSGIVEQANVKSTRPAIVFTTAITVYAEPKNNTQEVALLHEGTKVFVLQELDQWRHVRLPNGNEGWLNAGAIREIRLQ